MGLGKLIVMGLAGLGLVTAIFVEAIAISLLIGVIVLTLDRFVK